MAKNMETASSGVDETPRPTDASAKNQEAKSKTQSEEDRLMDKVYASAADQRKAERAKDKEADLPKDNADDMEAMRAEVVRVRKENEALKAECEAARKEREEAAKERGEFMATIAELKEQLEEARQATKANIGAAAVAATAAKAAKSTAKKGFWSRIREAFAGFLTKTRPETASNKEKAPEATAEETVLIPDLDNLNQGSKTVRPDSQKENEASKSTACTGNEEVYHSEVAYDDFAVKAKEMEAELGYMPKAPEVLRAMGVDVDGDDATAKAAAEASLGDITPASYEVVEGDKPDAIRSQEKKAGWRRGIKIAAGAVAATAALALGLHFSGVDNEIAEALGLKQAENTEQVDKDANKDKSKDESEKDSTKDASKNEESTSTSETDSNNNLGLSNEDYNHLKSFADGLNVTDVQAKNFADAHHMPVNVLGTAAAEQYMTDELSRAHNVGEPYGIDQNSSREDVIANIKMIAANNPGSGAMYWGSVLEDLQAGTDSGVDGLEDPNIVKNLDAQYHQDPATWQADMQKLAAALDGANVTVRNSSGMEMASYYRGSDGQLYVDLSADDPGWYVDFTYNGVSYRWSLEANCTQLQAGVGRQSTGTPNVVIVNHDTPRTTANNTTTRKQTPPTTTHEQTPPTTTNPPETTPPETNPPETTPPETNPPVTPPETNNKKDPTKDPIHGTNNEQDKHASTKPAETKPAEGNPVVTVDPNKTNHNGDTSGVGKPSHPVNNTGNYVDANGDSKPVGNTGANKPIVKPTDDHGNADGMETERPADGGAQ